jgi:trans-aconitate methyltransferase
MYHLPKSYYSREESNNYIDGHDSISNISYQPLVYKTAYELFEKTNAKYLIDIGCGDGAKLFSFKSKHDNCKLILIDHEYIIDNIVSKYTDTTYLKANFEEFIPEIDDTILSESIVICSDVVEHLLLPDVLLNYLSKCSRLAKGVVISTPDRVQERGLLDFGPPANPFHIREWTLDEFSRLLLDFGFSKKMLAGLTYSNNLLYSKATLICVFSQLFTKKIENKIIIDKLLLNKPLLVNDLKFNNINKLLSDNDVHIDDSTWYIITNDNIEYLPVNFNVSLEQQINLADKFGFNVIKSFNIHIKKNIDNIQKNGLVEKVYQDNSNTSISIIKGSIINEINNNKDIVINIYPINVICNHLKLKIKFMDKIRYLYKNSHSNLGQWHENITRKNYIIELAFGLDIDDEK